VRGKWNTDFLDELTRFPLDKHDDQVDASSGAFNYLSRMKSGGAW
jgi:predicted phage terminase large subunit-like protein